MSVEAVRELLEKLGAEISQIERDEFVLGRRKKMRQAAFGSLEHALEMLRDESMEPAIVEEEMLDDSGDDPWAEPPEILPAPAPEDPATVADRVYAVTYDSDGMREFHDVTKIVPPALDRVEYSGETDQEPPVRKLTEKHQAILAVAGPVPKRSTVIAKEAKLAWQGMHKTLCVMEGMGLMRHFKGENGDEWVRA